MSVFKDPDYHDSTGRFDLSELRAVAYECSVVLPFAALGALGYFAYLIP